MDVTAINHGRNERAYPNGRQPFSYIAIIRWAKENGFAYKWLRGECGGLDLCVSWHGDWARFRGNIK